MHMKMLSAKWRGGGGGGVVLVGGGGGGLNRCYAHVYTQKIHTLLDTLDKLIYAIERITKKWQIRPNPNASWK